MKTYTFRATTDLGGDGETYFDVELTDEEATLLEKYAPECEEFCECEELSAIYSKAYNVAVDVLTEELREYEEFEDEEEEEEWSADITYSITVLLPSCFEE